MALNIQKILDTKKEIEYSKHIKSISAITFKKNLSTSFGICYTLRRSYSNELRLVKGAMFHES